MSTEETNKWAEIFNAYIAGKTIQIWENEKYWVDISNIDNDILNRGLGRIRIKPEPKICKMTYQQLSHWLRENPQEHREYKCKGTSIIRHELVYCEGDENVPCENILIRNNNGEWKEPLIEIYD